MGGKASGDDERVVAALPRGDEHTRVAEIVGGLGDLPEVAEIGGAMASWVPR